MNLRGQQITKNQFISNISLPYLIDSISLTYGKDIAEISNKYCYENMSEEYCEYIISSLSNDNIFVDNIVLFTKEKLQNNSLELSIDKFIVGDGFSKIIIFNNLLTTRDFVLKRIDNDNLNVFKELYRDLFIKQCKLPGYYLDAVIANLYSKCNRDIRLFEMSYLRDNLPVLLITNSDETYMREYMINKNIINKLIDSKDIYNKINFKLIPYSTK